jgi:hypothetical protein
MHEMTVTRTKHYGKPEEKTTHMTGRMGLVEYYDAFLCIDAGFGIFQAFIWRESYMVLARRCQVREHSRLLYAVRSHISSLSDHRPRHYKVYRLPSCQGIVIAIHTALDPSRLAGWSSRKMMLHNFFVLVLVGWRMEVEAGEGEHSDVFCLYVYYAA